MNAIYAAVAAIYGVVSTAAPLIRKLNLFGGIVAGIWLAVLGQWGAIGLGILGWILSAFVIWIALLPRVEGSTGAYLASRVTSRSVMLAAVSCFALYSYLVTTAWSVFVFGFFMSRADSKSWIPMMVWAYGVAVSHWSYSPWLKRLAVKDAPYNTTSMAVLFGQIGSLAMMIITLFGRPPLLAFVTAFGTLALAGTWMQVRLAVEIHGHGIPISP